MSAFHYQALNNKTGKSIKGIIEADSERQARQLLRERGFIPIEVQSFRKQALKQKNKLATPDLALITRQLATLLAASIPVEEALQAVAEQTQKDKTKELLIGVRTKVLEGYALGQALGEFPHAFPELYRATVSAGEQTGRLDIVLEKLADYAENQQKNKQKIQQALIYPSLMIIVSIAIISFLLAFVVPKIIEVFTESGQTLPTMTAVLISLSQLIKSYSLIIALCLALFFLAFKKSLNNSKVRRVWHRSLLTLPVLAYLIKTINVARYIHTFSILFSAGVSVLETMRVSAGLITNSYMRDSFNLAATRVKEGMGISQALKDTQFISPMALHLIASGEQSSQIATMMNRAGAQLDNEVKQLIDSSLTLLEPLVILGMGGVVLFIVLATLLPVFSMEQLVN